jgi:hypothetical protein
MTRSSDRLQWPPLRGRLALKPSVAGSADRGVWLSGSRRTRSWALRVLREAVGGWISPLKWLMIDARVDAEDGEVFARLGVAVTGGQELWSHCRVLGATC